MTTIILLAIAGALISAVVGTLWYSPATPMGKTHMQYLGFDKLSEEEQKQKIEKAKPTMWKLYLAQMALSLLTMFAVVFIVTMSLSNGVPLQLAFGFVAMNWLCFMVPIVGGGIIWGNCDRSIAWKKFIFDSAFHLVVMLTVAYLASLFV